MNGIHILIYSIISLAVSLSSHAHLLPIPFFRESTTENTIIVIPEERGIIRNHQSLSLSLKDECPLSFKTFHDIINEDVPLIALTISGSMKDNKQLQVFHCYDACALINDARILDKYLRDMILNLKSEKTMDNSQKRITENIFGFPLLYIGFYVYEPLHKALYEVINTDQISQSGHAQKIINMLSYIANTKCTSINRLQSLAHIILHHNQSNAWYGRLLYETIVDQQTDLIAKKTIYATLGNKYYQENNINLAIKRYEQAIQLPTHAKLDEPILKRLIKIYTQLNNQEKISHYKHYLDVLSSPTQSFWCALTSCNIQEILQYLGC